VLKGRNRQQIFSALSDKFWLPYAEIWKAFRIMVLRNIWHDAISIWKDHPQKSKVQILFWSPIHLVNI